MLTSKPDTKRRKRNNELSITCEILPPGTLTRKRGQGESSKERWEVIVEICAEVIGKENENG